MLSQILVCFDGTPESQHALSAGESLAKLAASTVNLLAVVRPQGLEVAAESLAGQPAHQEQKAGLEKIMQTAIIQLQSKGIQAKGKVVIGNPLDVIVTQAKEVSANVIVLGHRQKSGLSRWWSDSLGRSLIDEAPCSVWISIA